MAPLMAPVFDRSSRVKATTMGFKVSPLYKRVLSRAWYRCEKEVDFYTPAKSATREAMSRIALKGKPVKQVFWGLFAVIHD